GRGPRVRAAVVGGPAVRAARLVLGLPARSARGAAAGGDRRAAPDDPDPPAARAPPGGAVAGRPRALLPRGPPAPPRRRGPAPRAGPLPRRDARGRGGLRVRHRRAPAAPRRGPWRDAVGSGGRGARGAAALPRRVRGRPRRRR